MEATIEQDAGLPHKRRQVIDWGSIHEPFKNLYKDEDKSLHDTMCILQDQFGFQAS